MERLKLGTKFSVEKKENEIDCEIKGNLIGLFEMVTYGFLDMCVNNNIPKELVEILLDTMKSSVLEGYELEGNK